MQEIRPLRLLVVGLACALIACGGDDARPQPGPFTLSADDPFCRPVVERVTAYYQAQSLAHPLPADPRYGGTVVVAGGGDLRGGLNGLSTSDLSTQETEAFLFHVTLVRFGADLKPEPYLAREWTLDQGGRGVTFVLRDDVVFHDGEPVTARDVAFTLRRAMDPAVGYPNGGWFALYDPDGIEVIDDHTIHLGFEPHAEALDPWASLAIMPEHLLGDVAPADLADHPFGTQCPVGAGPYLFEAYRPGDQWVLRANPAFPESLGGRPFIERFVYRVITDTPTRLAELLAGGADVALQLEPAQGEALSSRDDVELRVLDQRGYSFIGWNTRLPGLDDPRVRRAITMALDRQGLVRTLRGEYGQVTETAVPEFHWAFDDALAGPDYDPSAAITLLEDAGWTDRDGDGVRENTAGDELRFEVVTNPNPEREGTVQVLMEQLATVGIAIVPEILDFGPLQDRVMNPGQRDFGGFIMTWSNDFNINEYDLFHSSAAAASPYGWSGLSDAKLDRLLEALPRTLDRTEARPLWREYQQRIIELQPFTYLYVSQRLNGIDARLGGVVMDLRGELLSAPTWYWTPDAR